MPLGNALYIFLLFSVNDHQFDEANSGCVCHKNGNSYYLKNV